MRGTRQPHRTEGFKLSNDPFFIEKLSALNLACWLLAAQGPR
jgi:hypothetical protein